ncbi:MAG: sigma-54 dependent transcriptional regulator, partial [Candidatus Pacearchaeota archaeon]
ESAEAIIRKESKLVGSYAYDIWQELDGKDIHKSDSQTFNQTLVGGSPAFLRTIEEAKKLALTDFPIVIIGPRGCGKTTFAKAIHEMSPRKDYPLIKINCTSIPEHLLESEFFGYAKDSLDGQKAKIGKLELADGGTLFLDGVTEIPLSFQGKLLQVLQTQEFEPLGGMKTKKVNVRIVSATNHNIDEAIKEKSFREDLYYRLKGVEFEIPPLRERVEDIPPLVEFFIQKFQSSEMNVKVSQEAMQLLKTYRWSGNVRELQNVIHRAVILAKNGLITSKQLPQEIQNRNINNEELVSLEELEKGHIKKVLQTTNDYKEAAQILGIDLTTLWRKRKKYQID